MVRYLVCAWHSALKPLLATYNPSVVIPYPPDKDCLNSIEMVLSIPVAASYFYEYLRKRRNPRGLRAFDLYSEIRIFESYFRFDDTSNPRHSSGSDPLRNSSSGGKLFDKAWEIYRQYLNWEIVGEEDEDNMTVIDFVP